MSDDDTLESDCFTIPFNNENGSNVTEGLWTGKPQYDLPEGPSLRLATYHLIWERLNNQSQKIMQRFYETHSSEIMNFILNDYVEPPMSVPTEVPTALVIGGTSSTNSFVLKDLENRISHSQNAHISHIYGKECASLTVALRSLVLGFIGSIDIDEDEETGSTKQHRSGGPKLATHDLHLLETWYSALLTYNNDEPAKLVVMFHDIESMGPPIIEDLFSICGLHISRLPLVFVISLSTSPDYLHATLVRSAIIQLEITRFRAVDSGHQFEEIIQGLFFDLSFQPDIMLGPGVLDILAQTCEDKSASLDVLMTSLQLLLLEHCSHPLSALNTDEVTIKPDTDGGEPFFGNLRSKLNAQTGLDEDLQQIISTASNGDASSMLECVDELRKTFHDRALQFRAAFRLLIKLQKRLRPSRRNSKNINGFIHSACIMIHGEETTEHVSDVVGKIQKLPTMELQVLLQDVYEFFNEELPEDVRHEEMGTCAAIVLLINQVVQEAEETEASAEVVSPSKKQANIDLTNLEEVAALSGRQITASKFAGKVEDLLHKYFIERLKLCHLLPLAEVWCISPRSARSVENLRNPSIISSITSALIQPQDYLRCECCSQGSTGTLPDESLAFLRYLDGGKVINVYDWFETFAIGLESEDRGSGMESPTKKRKGRKKDDKPPVDKEELRKEHQARFLRCFHEFDMLGFLKHTGRKQDHVMRTVYELVD